MTFEEFLLVIIVIAVIGFVVYYLLRGSKGKLDIKRPIESRVDEYLDRRFEDIISEWALVTEKKLATFKDKADRDMGAEEARVSALKMLRTKTTADLDALEARIDALEKESGSNKPAPRSP